MLATAAGDFSTIRIILLVMVFSEYTADDTANDRAYDSADDTAADTADDTACVSENLRYLTIPGIRIASGIFKTIRNITIEKCQTKCSKNEQCKSAVYNLKTSECNLHSKDRYSDRVKVKENVEFIYIEMCSNTGVDVAGCSEIEDILAVSENFGLTIFCYITSTGWAINMTCPQGTAWDDGAGSTKIIECHCNRQTWPQLSGKCLGFEDLAYIYKSVTCPDLTPVDNAAIGHTGMGQHYMDTNEYKCESGYYRVSGDRLIMCGPDGEWIGNFPVCVKATQKSNMMSTEPTSISLKSTSVAPTTILDLTTQVEIYSSAEMVMHTTKNILTTMDVSTATEDQTTESDSVNSPTSLDSNLIFESTSLDTVATVLVPASEPDSTAQRISVQQYQTTRLDSTLEEQEHRTTSDSRLNSDLRTTIDSHTTKFRPPTTNTFVEPTIEMYPPHKFETTRDMTSITDIESTTKIEMTLPNTDDVEFQTTFESTVLPSATVGTTIEFGSESTSDNSIGFDPEPTEMFTNVDAPTTNIASIAKATLYKPLSQSVTEVTTEIDYKNEPTISALVVPIVDQTSTPEPKTSGIRCQSLPESPNNHTYIYLNNSNIATIWCKEGYKLYGGQNQLTLSCLPNGTWDLGDLLCEKYICPHPPLIAETILVSVNRHEGGKAKYSCTEGKVFQDGSSLMTLTCDNMQWAGVRQQCRKMRCSEFSLPNTVISLDQGPVYSMATIQCDVGHQFADGTTVRSVQCVGDEFWNMNPRSMQCHARSCDKWPEDDSIKITYDTELIKSGTKFRAKCRDGKTFENGLNQISGQCSSTGKWSATITKCSDSMCQEPAPYLPNASLKLRGHNLTYSCKPGYRYRDGTQSKSLHCSEASGVIGREPYVCHDIICKNSPNISLSQQNTTMATFGTVIEYQCPLGYWFTDHSFIKTTKCKGDGSWSIIGEQNCTEVLCPDLSDLLNVSLNSTLRSVSTVFEAVCANDTLRFTDGTQRKVLTCLNTGEWDYLLTNCESNICPPVPDVEFASPNTTLAVYGTVVIYTCDKGYEFVDEQRQKVVECSRKLQTWNITFNECKTIECSAISENHLETSSNDTSYGSVVSGSCHLGYEFTKGLTNISVLCASDKQWHCLEDHCKDININNGCRSIECPPLNIPNASVNTTSSSYNTTVTISCNKGFWFEDRTYDQQTTCDITATWNDVITCCQAIHCPSIPLWLNIQADITETIAGVKVIYKCRQGYHFESSDGVNSVVYGATQCSAEGVWEPPFQQCVAEIRKAAQLEEPSEAPNASSIGLIAAAVVSLTISTFLALDIPVLLRHINTKMIRNIQRRLGARIRKGRRIRRYSRISKDADITGPKSTWL